MNWLLALVLTTTTFTPGGTVPMSMVAVPCGGQNVAPALHWSDPPRGVVSWALIVHDPDAPHPGGFYHWVEYGSHLSQSGTNDTGATGYFGPCPPPGKVHHYHFTLYALDTTIVSAKPLTAPQLLARMHGHILAQTTLIGTYASAK
jgi:phosphatidylethanolamine-binding protein (PEBP) family uncharacterized protein